MTLDQLKRRGSRCPPCGLDEENVELLVIHRPMVWAFGALSLSLSSHGYILGALLFGKRFYDGLKKNISE